METPWDAARTIAGFLNEKFKEYNEKEHATGKPYTIYAGYLPRKEKAADMKELCPAIVIRPLMIEDGAKQSIAKMVIYAVTFDDGKGDGVDGKGGEGNKQTACEALYHVLEFMRYHLLANNPIKKQYQIKLTEDDTMETFIPDDQPFPFWEGRIDFSVFLEQPKNNSFLAGMNTWGRQKDVKS